MPLVFDKKYGLVPIWSEYYFLSNMTKTENKYCDKKETKLVYPLCIKGPTNSRQLTVMDPATSEILHTSDKFNERNFLQKYNTDENFRYWFDRAVDISVEQRINVALFRFDPKANVQVEEEVSPITKVTGEEIEHEEETNSDQVTFEDPNQEDENENETIYDESEEYEQENSYEYGDYQPTPFEDV